MNNKQSTLLKKIGRYILIFLLCLFSLIFAVLLLIQTKPVQNYARNEILVYLIKKLKTKIEIDTLKISFPKMIVLEGVYIEDLKKDTLLYANSLMVDISMYKLLFGEVEINDVRTSALKAKILRQSPDLIFNYQFIIDAFKPANPKADDRSTMKMGVDHIFMEKSDVTFNDEVTGNYVTFFIDSLDTEIDVFDPVSIQFDVPEITISGVRGKIFQSSAIEIVTSKKTENPGNNTTPVKTNHLKINNKHLKATDIRFDYINEVSALNTSFKFNKLDVFPEKIDLSLYEIYFKKVELDQFDGVVKIGSEQDSKLITIVTGEGEVLEKSYLPWKIKSAQIKISESRLKFDDMTKVKLNYGMDFGHLDVKKLHFKGDNFYFHRDSIRINIKGARLRESSGFVLDHLQSDVLYTAGEIRLLHLHAKTPGSELRENFNISYPSLNAAVANPSLFNFNLEFVQSTVQIKDILLFVPLLRHRPGFNNPDQTMRLEGRMTGSLKRLRFESIIFQSFLQTKASFSGIIENISDPDNIYVNLNIRNISTSSEDIKSIAADYRIPENVTLPKTLALNGTIIGDMDSLFANAKVVTSSGDAGFIGYVKKLNHPAQAAYNADVTLVDFSPGEILKQAGLVDNIHAAFNINGVGTDLETAKIKINGVVNHVKYNQYNYTNIALNSHVNGRYFKANGSIRDPNISLRFSGEGEMTSGFPCIIMDADIDIINARALHFTNDKITYGGNIWMEIPAFDPERLIGEIHVTDSDLRLEDKKILLDSMSLKASYDNDIQTLNLKSDFLNASMEGVIPINKLGYIFKNLLHPYYKFRDDTLSVPVYSHNFKITAQLNDHPAIRLFLPGLQRLEKISLNAFFADTSGWNADLQAPFLSYQGNVVYDSKMEMKADGQQLVISTELGKIKIGEKMVMNGTKLSAVVADQEVNFSMRIGDKENLDRYLFGGKIEDKTDYYILSLKSDLLMLNYDQWDLSQNNAIRFGKQVFNVDNFDLSKNNQHLIIKSKSSSDNSPLEILFTDFQLSTLTDFALADSMKVDGTLDGLLTIDNIIIRPVFTSDILIRDLFVNADTIGDIRIHVSNEEAKIYKADIALTGRENDVRLTGNYSLKPEDKANLDFLLNIKSLQMKTLEGASMGNIRESKGYLSGKVNIGGSLTSPDIDGNLEFFKASMIIDKLNSTFKVDNGQLLAIDNTGLRFNDFTIKDVSDNRFVINGMAYTKNYFNYNFDLKMRARNFKALNSTRADNQAYYGQIIFDTDMKISGTEAAPVVDGRIRINEGTALTIVVPQKEPGMVAREGVVVFVDKSKPVEDAEGAGALDSLNTTSFKGMDVSVNIEVDKKAVLTLVIDEGNNDFIKLKGEAVLNGGIDKSGKVTLTGTYELDEGTYEMSFNLIERSFKIQKGSKITWTGEPTDATMDITAVYVANTTAVELVQDQIVAARTDLRYRQRLPFEVHLSMKAALLKPELSFEIKLPKESTVRIDGEIANQIEMRLSQLKAEASELNKQVFSLLILNRFTSQNPFETAGGGLNPESMARQSVSKIMTEQLNNLADNLISGVDVDFDIVSSEDFTSGKMQNKTDLNVGVSKKLFSERLHVSVGTNFAVEGAQKNSAGTNPGASNVPNLNIEYLISKDGQYMIRAYRRNQYEGIVEGYIVETGIGFVMSVDYETFKDIFSRRKSNKNIRVQQKVSEIQNQVPVPASDNKDNNKQNQKSDYIRKDEDE